MLIQDRYKKSNGVLVCCPKCKTNIYVKEKMKDVDYKKAISSIKKWLKEPEFTLNG